MVEIEKTIGKKMNANPETTKYIYATQHKRHYYMVDSKKAWDYYNRLKG